MKESELRNQAKAFAKHIVFACRQMKNDGLEFALINQLLRAGTSIGANLYESEHAQSPKDYLSKFEIALKECNETAYWLDLLHDTGSIDQSMYAKLNEECTSVMRMLIASIKTLKTKNC